MYVKSEDTGVISFEVEQLTDEQKTHDGIAHATAIVCRQ